MPSYNVIRPPLITSPSGIFTTNSFSTGPRLFARSEKYVGSKKYDEAIAFLNNYATAHPASTELWRVYAGLGEAYGFVMS